MQQDEESWELKARITGLSDEELLTIVEEEAGEYREDAVGFAKAELEARGIEFNDGSAEDESAEDLVEEPERAAATGSRKGLMCSVCGGETRFGILSGSKEVTIIFADNNEERYVEAYACTRCGRVQLIVDYGTDAQP
jgi:hypothetical protein